MIKGSLKYQSSLLLFCILVYPVFAYNGASANNRFTTSDKTIIAKVGETGIRFEDYFERYTDFLLSTGIKDNVEARKAILNSMINEELLLHFDNSYKIKTDEKYLADIAWAKKRTVLAFLKDREIYSKISVTENELRNSFERANERLAARHLFAQTEEQANNLYELLQIGVSFDLLAQQSFTDSVLRNNGGYLGYFTWGDMDPAFEDEAFALKVGEISKPVKTAQGYSIIKLEDRVSHPLITETQFLQKKSYIERIVKLKKKSIEEQKYIQKLFNPEKVIFNSPNLLKVLTELRGTSNAEIKKTKKNTLICAKHEHKSYSNKDILKRLGELPDDLKMKIISLENLQDAIRGFILQDKLLQIALKKGYNTLPEVVQVYEKSRKAIFLKFKIDEITNAITFTDSMLLNYYNANSYLFSSEKELNIQEIIVNQAGLADSIKIALVSGSDFGTLASSYSERRWSAKNNGVMGFAPAPKYGVLKDTLWLSSIGSLIGPIKIQNRFGVFKVLGKKESEPIPFELVKNQVANSLKMERQKSIVQEYIDKLQKKAKIEINEQQLRVFTTTDLASQN
jgi:parvulin-like peptidyl-prolyl isomerase